MFVKANFKKFQIPPGNEESKISPILIEYQIGPYSFFKYGKSVTISFKLNILYNIEYQIGPYNFFKYGKSAGHHIFQIKINVY